jgi:hypothetical protein
MSKYKVVLINCVVLFNIQHFYNILEMNDKQWIENAFLTKQLLII